MEHDQDRLAAEVRLLASLRERSSALTDLLHSCSDHWGFEDLVYRFYHQSFKVYGVQAKTTMIVSALQDLLPDRGLNAWFLGVVREGTGREFSLDDNARWLEATRPLLEAFFHARFFLEMAVRYSSLETPPRPLPSGYAALLYLFDLR